MYWCSPLPVRRLQPAESYNSLSFSSFSWKGATTPSLALALAKILVRRCWPTEGYNLLFLPPGTMFHQFSDWIHWSTTLQSEDHVSSNFHTGPINIIEPHKHLATSTPNTETLSTKTVTRTQSRTLNSATIFRTNCIIKNHSLNGIRYLDEPNPRTYALLSKPTHVQIYKYSIKTCSYLKLNLYLVQNITCVSI